MVPRLLSLAVLVAAVAGASGCATLTRDGEQRVDIMVRNQDGRPINAKCRVENSSGVIVGNAPLMQVPVDRSGSDLVVECTPFNGAPVARGVAVSRSVTSLALVVQPLAASVIDGMSGRMFDYPSSIVLVSGKLRTFDLSSRTPGPTSAPSVPAPSATATTS